MGTVIDQIDIASSHLRHRHSALHLGVAAAKDCLRQAGCHPDELDLLVNAGIYRDRNLGEPALAALIQDDIGANPEDPHAGGHGTFSFDIANGTCGVLTALQIVDGFLRAHTIERALVVASDADPGHGMSDHFPFAAAGAALLCSWTDDEYGLGRVHWVSRPAASEAFSATVGFEDARNVLRVTQSPELDAELAEAAAEAARACLTAQPIPLRAIELIVAAPARERYRTELSKRLGVPVERIAVCEDEAVHTAALPAALLEQVGHLQTGARVLLVAAGSGVTAGAAIYRQPPRPA